MALVLWPAGPTYQGRTVEQWFRDCATSQWFKDFAATGEMGPSGEMFRSLGTNVVPFLASRISGDLSPSRLERWTSKLPARFQAGSRAHQAHVAAFLLHQCVKPPENMVRELLKPAALSTNADQVFALEIVLGSDWREQLEDRAVSPGNNSANQPLLASVTVLQPNGSRTVRTTNSEHIKLIKDWLHEVQSTQPPREQIGAVAPWCTFTFSGGSSAASTNLIFSIRDRTTRARLLTDEQRQRLMKILTLN